MCEMRIPGEVISVGIHFLNRELRNNKAEK